MTGQDVAVIAAIARYAELLDADACAFLLCVRGRDGTISRRGFLERVAVKGSFPRPVVLPDVGKRWRRVDVVRWAEDEARIAATEAAGSLSGKKRVAPAASKQRREGD